MDAMSELAKRAVKTTRGGKEINFFDPDPSQFDLLDIAYSLSHIVRWTGHCPGLVVAQHSCIVADIVVSGIDSGFDLQGARRAELELAALLHDAPEAYTGDISTPLKTALSETFRAIESRLQRLIFEKFRLDPDLVHHPLVAAADKLAMQFECVWYRDGLGVIAGEDIDPGANGEFLTDEAYASVLAAINDNSLGVNPTFRAHIESPAESRAELLDRLQKGFWQFGKEIGDAA